MWTGAISGFAVLKFSTSPRVFGMFDTIAIIIKDRINIGRESFTMNRG